mmetsp:Transcript_114438/g.363726  ORF Transcript_114438/g.363726 Transcript_114438/m.363726 type:complete len:241 (+) Transcript_114438:397-1119(+)
MSLGVADVLPALARPLGERRLELRQLHEAWPLLDRGCAQLFEDLVDGTDFRVAREQRRPRRHLCNNATDAPDVHRRALDRATEEDLRGPVPNGDHLGRLIANEHGIGPREAEVRDLQSRLGVDEEVLRLQVTVQDPVGMTELDPIAQLVGQVLDDLGLQFMADRLHVLPKVVLDELEDEHQFVPGAEDVQQLDAFGCERAFVSDTSRMEVLGTPSSFDSLLSFIATTSPVLTFLALYTMA